MMTDEVSKNFRRQMQLSADHCLECFRACSEAMAHTIDLRRQHWEHEHYRILLDCIDVCKTTAGFLIRQSDYYKDICSVCALICKETTKCCQEFGNDPFMLKAGDIASKCAKSCLALTQNQSHENALEPI